MRMYNNRGVAGNCGCCLVPIVLLAVIAVAMLVTTALVWESATRSGFGWGWTRHHHADAYRAGFQEGHRIGAEYASRGEPEPTEADLDVLAIREAGKSHVTRDRRQWMQGFRRGFARGFESASKEVFHAPLMLRPVFAAAWLGDKHSW